MQQPNKAVFSSGMQALIASIQEGETKLTTPDGAPTVAAKHMAALAPQQQMQQPGMTPPPQGSAAPEGGIAGIAQNAATGNNINDMKQKQAEQAMMQMAQQQQQQQPTQMMASGGIAELPAENMRGFAEGGVIGFAGDGEQGSEVPSLVERIKEQAIKEALLRQKRVQQSQPEITLESLFNAGRRARGLDAPTAASGEKPVAPAGGVQFQYKPEGASNMLSALMAESRRVQDPAEKAAVMAQIEKMMQAGVTPLPTAPSSAPVGTQYAEARPERVMGNVQPYTPQAAAPATGIAGIAEELNRVYAPQNKAAEERVAAREKLAAERLPVGAGNIEALMEAQRAREALDKQLKESKGVRSLDALLAGLAGRNTGETMGAFRAGEIKSERDRIAETLINKQLIAAQQELQNAQRLGDFDKAAAARDKIDEIEARKQQQLMQLAGVVYGADERAEAARGAADTAATRLKISEFQKEAKNLDDAIKKAIAKRTYAPQQAKIEYETLVKERNAMAAKYGLDNRTVPPEAFDTAPATSIDTSKWANFKSGTSK